LVFRFELYEKLSFLSSLEVLLIFESLIQSDGSSSLILESPSSGVVFLFCKFPNQHPPFSPIFVLGFIHVPSWMEKISNKLRYSISQGIGLKFKIKNTSLRSQGHYKNLKRCLHKAEVIAWI